MIYGKIDGRACHMCPRPATTKVYQHPVEYPMCLDHALEYYRYSNIAKLAHCEQKEAPPTVREHR